MAAELQLRIHAELCKTTSEKMKLVVQHLKIKDEEVKDKSKASVINVIANAIEKELASLDEEEKVALLQAIVEIFVDTPPPLEEVNEDKSELLKVLKKEIEELKLLHQQKTSESSSKVKQELSSKSGDDMPSSLNALVESTSVLRRQFKLTGQIGDPDQKDKLNYSSLRKQIDTGVAQKYKEHEIVDGVIRGISPGLTLRSYLESFETLSLDRLKKILRSHYGVKNTAELYQSLASICQHGKETPQAFLMRALDLRQKILFASQEGEDPLKYDTNHIQQLFRRTVETGLQDESMRTKLRPYLSNPLVEDEELIHQLNVAVSAEEERVKKLKGQSKVKSPVVSQIGELPSPSPELAAAQPPAPKKDPKSPGGTKTEIQELKAEVEALKADVKARSGTTPQSGQGRGSRWSSGRGDGRREGRSRPPKCSACLAKGEQWCNHCFKCGSDSHYAVGCRRGESSGQRPLNGNRLLLRDRK